MSNLALLLEKLNKLIEAEALNHEALKFFKTNCLSNHPNIRISMNNLALILQSLN